MAINNLANVLMEAVKKAHYLISIKYLHSHTVDDTDTAVMYDGSDQGDAN